MAPVTLAVLMLPAASVKLYACEHTADLKFEARELSFKVAYSPTSCTAEPDALRGYLVQLARSGQEYTDLALRAVDELYSVLQPHGISVSVTCKAIASGITSTATARRYDYAAAEGPLLNND